MGALRWTLVIVCIMLMIGTLGMMVSAVDWTDDVTDPVGDAESDGTADPSRTDVDIISVSITEDGDNMNVTMVLAGKYNSSGTYTVSVEVDGDKSLDFTRMSFLGFTVTDDDINTISVDGYYSEDGTILSWVVAKEDVDAQNDVEIEICMATYVDLMGSEPTYTDYAGLGGVAGGIPLPGTMKLDMYFDGLNVLVMKATMTYSGDNATSFRVLADENADGTVSAAEVQALEDDMFDDSDDTNASESNMTLDGMDPTDLVWDNSLVGVKGAVDSTASVKVSATSTLTFPKVEDADTHVIEFKDGFMGDDFVGGDEPWDDEFEVTFKLSAPDGWKFKGGSLPSKMKDYLNDDGDEIKLEGTDFQSEWNDTFGALTTLTIEESDESPGFGLTLAVGATLLLAVVASRRRR